MMRRGIPQRYADRLIPDAAAEIIVAVCQRHKVPVADVLSDSRYKPHLLARQELMASLYPQFRSAKVGQMLGKDHSTVLWGARRHRERLQEQQECAV